MSKLFKFVRDPQTGINCGGNSIDQVVSQAQVPESKSDRLAPDGGTIIDVVKDFKWTKTRRNSVGRENTPTLELQEFYVTLPAFFSNLNVAKQIVTTAGKAIGSLADNAVGIAGMGASVTSIVKDVVKKVDKEVETGISKARKAFGVQESATKFDGQKYLTAYEHLYGVKRSNFIYKLPYLEDQYKEVNNSWGDGEGTLNQSTTNIVDKIKNAFSFAAPGVGIDFAKSFQYASDGPSHNITFYLDNTKDSEYGKSMYETNFRLIYLLLYQNMPNKLNRLALVPPVIYRAKLPGVFSYRYSFLSKVGVTMLGTRKMKNIPNFITTENNRAIDVVIPEGYEITMTLQSLIPETQNLYFDAINNPVFSTQA
tara:strand:- start:632 stop:1735 length:1104 start_codon:yes stop_codon:yes gene_type:complete